MTADVSLLLPEFLKVGPIADWGEALHDPAVPGERCRPSAGCRSAYCPISGRRARAFWSARAMRVTDALAFPLPLNWVDRCGVWLFTGDKSNQCTNFGADSWCDDLMQKSTVLSQSGFG